MNGENALRMIVILLVGLFTIGAVSYLLIPTFPLSPISVIDPPPNMERGEIIK